MTTGPDQLATPDSTVQLTEVSLQPVGEWTPAELLARANSLSPDERLWLVAAIWCSLPPEHPAAPGPTRLHELHRYLEDYAQGRIDALPWQAVQGLMAGQAYIEPAKIYSVPRRFDLATIFVVTLAYSLLFGAMSGLGCPPLGSVMIAGFILIVGAAQAVLFGGKKPRTASVLAGAVIFFVGMIAYWISIGPRLYSSPQIVIPASFIVATGGMLGYISGTIIGGVFLVADKLRSLLSRRHAELDD